MWCFLLLLSLFILSYYYDEISSVGFRSCFILQFYIEHSVFLSLLLWFWLLWMYCLYLMDLLCLVTLNCSTVYIPHRLCVCLCPGIITITLVEMIRIFLSRMVSFIWFDFSPYNYNQIYKLVSKYRIAQNREHTFV